MDLIIGSHVSISGGLLGAAMEAKSYGANAFMIYTGAPQNTIRKALSGMKLDEGRKFMQNEGIAIENIIVHAPYIINLATDDLEKKAFAADFLKKEIERTEAIGAPYIVVHPGSCPDRERGTFNAAETLNTAMTEQQKPSVLIETMAGRGSELGRSFEEIRDILSAVKYKDKTGVCLDTCHIFDSGYDIFSDFLGVMEEFDRIVGLDKIKAVHINGSLNAMGSRKDRHANIGADAGNPKGVDRIGFDAINRIVHSEYLKGRIFILETPWLDEKTNLYREEIAMLRKGN